MIVEIVEHRDESATCHKRVISCFMAAFLFEIFLYIFIINVRIWAENFLVETRFV